MIEFQSVTQRLLNSSPLTQESIALTGGNSNSTNYSNANMPSDQSASTGGTLNEINGVQTSVSKILIVDDQSAVRDFLSECLNCMGYETFAASGGAEALEIYKSNINEISLVITDMTMPEISGIELAANLFRFNKNVKVLLTTGYDMTLISTMPPSIIGTIFKPYNLSDLSSAIEKALSASS